MSVAGGHRARAFSYSLSGRKDLRSRRCLVYWDMRKARQAPGAMPLLGVHSAPEERPCLRVLAPATAPGAWGCLPIMLHDLRDA